MIIPRRLPESWALASYLSVIIQLANVGPLLYGFLRDHVPAHWAINALLVLGVFASLFLALFWDETTFFAGQERSTSLFILVRQQPLKRILPTFLLLLVVLSGVLAVAGGLHVLDPLLAVHGSVQRNLPQLISHWGRTERICPRHICFIPGMSDPQHTLSKYFTENFSVSFREMRETR